MAARKTRRSTEPLWLAFGVDPGKGGAIALIGRDGFADGRVVDTKEPEQIAQAVEDLCVSACAVYSVDDTDGLTIESYVKKVYVEDVHSMPGEGHVGVFSFGQAKGVPWGWFAARGYARGLVSPQAWQARFFGDKLFGKDKDRRKAEILAAARKRWPEASLGRAKDEAVAAALYIAQAGVEKEKSLCP